MVHQRTIVFGFSAVIRWLLSIFFIIMALQTTSGLDDPSPEHKKASSLCLQYHRVTTTQQESYIETYEDYNYNYGRFDEKTRINFRTQEISKWVTVETCCQGYEPHELAADAERCVPICPSDCVNGTCHRPNECVCDAGFKVSLNESTGFSECQPSCSSGCHGGSCVEPEICSCDEGYTLAEDWRSCEASCVGVGGGGLEGCGHNASCIAPDTCTCDEGYEAFSKETVTTDHPHDSDQSVSTWYHFVKSTSATPLNMVLKPTFNLSSVLCRPQCQPACGETANCVAPNKCQCKTGYSSTSSPGGPIECLPVCKPTCVNSFCTGPNECACHEGYKPHQLLGTIFCEPICHKNCINAKCTLPNHCECADGFEKLVVERGLIRTASDNFCFPICQGNCTNGRCVAPGQCHCNPGYALNQLPDDVAKASTDITGDIGDHPHQLQPQESCQPVCKPGCPDGSLCVAPNQCQNRFDYEKSYDSLPRKRTRVINYANDCGNGDAVLINDRPICVYDVNGTRCSEPNPCAIVVSENPGKNMDSFFLQSIIFINNFTKSGNNETTHWWMSRCTDECRVLVPPRRLSEHAYKLATDCYELELHNVTTGLLLPSEILPNSVRGNKTLLCFLKDAAYSNPDMVSTADTTESKIVGGTGSKLGDAVGGIIGTAVVLVLVVTIGVAIHSYRRKSRRRFSDISASKDTVMERSEMSPFNTGES